MSEIKETTDKTLRGDVRKPLSLKRTVESGHVRQSFSHGRSKSVVVEKKKKRTISAPGAEAEEATAPEAAEALVAELAQQQRQGGLSTDEVDARRRALEAARERSESEERERARLEALKLPPPAWRNRRNPGAWKPPRRRGRAAGRHVTPFGPAGAGTPRRRHAPPRR